MIQRKLLLPGLLLAIFVAITYGITQSKPPGGKRPNRPAPRITVETQTITPVDYQVRITSFGKIAPRTQAQLVSQVSGQIIAVHPAFREGGFFDRGEVLVTIDPRDYEIQVEIAAAELADALVALDEQQALADQAVKDRRNLGTTAEASDFALRKPQVAAAQSRIDSARAKLKQAKLAVERTRITAPYAGRILNKNADLGQVVNTNTSLATIYATDLVEIALPLKNNELGFVQLPEQYRQGGNGASLQPDVTLTNTLGNVVQQWPGKIVRTAGSIDSNSQQLNVIAQINDPYSRDNLQRRPLKIGQFVTAEIKGKRINDAIVIPNAAIYQGSYVYLYIDGALARRDVDIAWQNQQEALISDGIQPGDQLVLTSLGQITSGTLVNLAGDSRPKGQLASDRRRGDGKGQGGGQRNNGGKAQSAGGEE